MSVEGIWKIEILGPYGWEAVSTAFLQNGRYLSASQDHYSVGQYQVNDGIIKVVATTHAHSPSHNLFGASEAQLEFRFEGEVDDHQISGQAEDGEGQNSLTLRGTRLAALP